MISQILLDFFVLFFHILFFYFCFSIFLEELQVDQSGGRSDIYIYQQFDIFAIAYMANISNCLKPFESYFSCIVEGGTIIQHWRLVYFLILSCTEISLIRRVNYIRLFMLFFFIFSYRLWRMYISSGKIIHFYKSGFKKKI